MANDNSQFYPGWTVLAAVFFCALLIIGGSIYVYQLFVLPVTEEFRISRGDASLAFVGLLVGIAVWSPFIGRLYDRVSAKWLIPIGGISYAVGLAILSVSQTLWLSLLAIPVFLGLAMAAAGGLAANTITTRWFERRRGRALGIASIASSAGGFVMVPIVTFLIENFDWRTALMATGLSVGAIIVLIGLFVVRDRPSAEQKSVFGEFADAVDDGPEDAPLWTFASLLKSRNFWLLNAGVGLLLASDQAVLTSKYPYLVDIGFSAAQAASVVTAMTGSAIAGKYLVGYLSERFDVRWLYGLVALFHILLLCVYLLEPGYIFMLVFASIFGAAVGGIYPVWSMLCAKAFGADSFGVAFGAMALFTQVLAIAFVRFIGVSFDQTGSYSFAFSLFIGAVVIGLLAIMAMRFDAPPKPEASPTVP